MKYIPIFLALTASLQANASQFQCTVFGKFQGGNSPHHEYSRDFVSQAETEELATQTALGMCHRQTNDCRLGYCEEVVPIPYPDQSNLKAQTDAFCYGKGGFQIEVIRGNTIYDAIAIVQQNGKQLAILPVKATVPDDASRPVFYEYENGYNNFQLIMNQKPESFFFQFGLTSGSGEAHCITPSVTMGDFTP